MSAALFASKLIKLDEEKAPAWVQTKEGKTKAVLAGNLFGIILVAAMVFGFVHLAWWIPIACVVITFPALHVIVFERLFSESKGVVVCGALAAASSGLLWFYW